METITSTQNPKVKLIQRLRGKRSRQQEKRFVIEYERDLQRALKQGYQIDFMLICPEIAGSDAAPFAPAEQRFLITLPLLKRLTYRENPTGVIAVMHTKTSNGLVDLEHREPQFVLVLDDLRVPGNIGALLRTANAAGIDAVILVDSALDLYNPNIIRSSTGACFSDDIYFLSSVDADQYFERRGFQLLAADAMGDTTAYDVALRQPAAVILGAEDRGLSEYWRGRCDQLVRVPMTGQLVDSLNVSVTGAIIMYEMSRQKQFSGSGAKDHLRHQIGPQHG